MQGLETKTLLGIFGVVTCDPTVRLNFLHRLSSLICFGEGLCHFSDVRAGNQTFSFPISFRHVDSIFGRGFLFDYKFLCRCALQ
jgi:hypothetical protein